MTYLRSIFDRPDTVRSSFLDAAEMGCAGFRIEVGEPVGGPLVLHVAGGLDAATVPTLGHVLDEAVTCGRGVVLDLLEVVDLDRGAAEVIGSAATRLRGDGLALTVAARPDTRAALGADPAAAGASCHATFADAFTAARSGAR